MEHLEYKVEISAPAKKVWETMLSKETYPQWTNKSWPGSTFEGKWEKGEEIKFVSPEGGGTMAKLEEVKPYEKIFARHVAVINPDGSLDRTSETAKGWIGTTEAYKFIEKNGKTTVIVSIETTPAWKSMFDDGWPTALQELKNLSERQLSAV